MEQVKDLTGINVGDKLTMAYSGISQADSYCWVSVTKVTPKTLNVQEHGQQAYGHTFEFRMKAPYTGAAVRLESYGSGNYYNLYRATTPEDIATVDAAYAKRAAASSAEKAAKDEKVRKAQEREAKEKADALAANFQVEFQEIGLLGNQRYFAANVLNHNNRMCFAVVGVRRDKEVDWDAIRSTNGEREYKMVWRGMLNYAENRGDEYSIGTMASCSPDEKADTLPELFQNVIARIW